MGMNGGLRVPDATRCCYTTIPLTRLQREESVCQVQPSNLTSSKSIHSETGQAECPLPTG